MNASGNVVDIWPLSYDEVANDPADLFARLSNDEQCRAEALVDKVEANRFVVRRALLRRVLAHYLGPAATFATFAVGRYGKPRLAQSDSAARINFSVSDSGKHFVIAVARGFEVGVDIEGYRKFQDPLSIARRFLTQQEAAEIDRKPIAERSHALLTCWARKEAVVKADGRGMSLGTKTLNVGIAPLRPEGLSLSLCGRAFLIKDMPPNRDHVGAVAAEAENFELRLRRTPLALGPEPGE